MRSLILISKGTKKNHLGLHRETKIMTILYLVSARKLFPMIVIAILFPGLSFLLRGKIISAILAIILQVMAVFFFLVFGIGALLWIILAVWAIASYNEAKRVKRHKQILKVWSDEKVK